MIKIKIAFVSQIILKPYAYETFTRIQQTEIKMVLELTAKNFENEVLQSKLPVIVDFWASWCGPCKMLAPIFEEVSKTYSGKLKFAKISTEDFPTIAEDYGVMGIPCLIIFNHGEEVDRIIGFAPKEVLKQKINAILEKV